MADNQIRVLLVEDDPADAELIQRTLRQSERNDFELTHVARLGEAVGRLSEEGIDVILLDPGLPDSWGLETFIEIHGKASAVPTVILADLDIQAFAMEAIKLGAQDYLIKGNIDTHILETTIGYAIERKRLEYETIAAREAAPEAKRTTKETSAIDRAAFESLRKILGDDAQELTRSYLDESAELLKAMKQSLEQKDWEGLDRSAHTLKGSSLTIGAKGLAEICQQLQIIVESKEPGQTVEKLMELEDGFDKVKRELGNLLV